MAIGFVNDSVTYIVLRFFQGALSTYAYLGGFVYCCELVSEKYRAWIGYYYHMNYVYGEFLVPVFGLLFFDWRRSWQANIFIMLPALLMFILPESFQFLHTKGRNGEVVKVLTKISKFNKIRGSNQDL